MIQRAQQMLKQLQVRVKTTLTTVANLAESVGIPASVTSLLQQQGDGVSSKDGDSVSGLRSFGPAGSSAPAVTTAPPPWRPPLDHGGAEAQLPESAKAPTNGKPGRSAANSSTDDRKPRRRRRTTARRRRVTGNQLPEGVLVLQVDDAINGSTYLARILWALGVAQLEGLGALRPADIARMIMSRSAVSLEPPNVARYIRRSNPTCMVVDRIEGNSNFYKLNAAGKRLFDEHFRAN